MYERIREKVLRWFESDYARQERERVERERLAQVEAERRRAELAAENARQREQQRLRKEQERQEREAAQAARQRQQETDARQKKQTQERYERQIELDIIIGRERPKDLTPEQQRAWDKVQAKFDTRPRKKLSDYQRDFGNRNEHEQGRSFER